MGKKKKKEALDDVNTQPLSVIQCEARSITQHLDALVSSLGSSSDHGAHIFDLFQDNGSCSGVPIAPAGVAVFDMADSDAQHDDAKQYQDDVTTPVGNTASWFDVCDDDLDFSHFNFGQTACEAISGLDGCSNLVPGESATGMPGSCLQTSRTQSGPFTTAGISARIAQEPLQGSATCFGTGSPGTSPGGGSSLASARVALEPPHGVAQVDDEGSVADHVGATMSTDVLADNRTILDDFTADGSLSLSLSLSMRGYGGERSGLKDFTASYSDAVAGDLDIPFHGGSNLDDDSSAGVSDVSAPLGAPLSVGDFYLHAKHILPDVYGASDEDTVGVGFRYGCEDDADGEASFVCGSDDALLNAQFLPRPPEEVVQLVDMGIYQSNAIAHDAPHEYTASLGDDSFTRMCGNLVNEKSLAWQAHHAQCGASDLAAQAYGNSELADAALGSFLTNEEFLAQYAENQGAFNGTPVLCRSMRCAAPSLSASSDDTQAGLTVHKSCAGGTEPNAASDNAALDDAPSGAVACEDDAATSKGYTPRESLADLGTLCLCDGFDPGPLKEMMQAFITQQTALLDKRDALDKEHNERIMQLLRK